MKCIVFLYRDDTVPYGDAKEFNGKSARELCLAKACAFCEKPVVIDRSSVADMAGLFAAMNASLSKTDADFAVFCYDDLPFFNLKLTEKLIDVHKKYKAEYTFADGYPYGFAPEIIDAGTLRILEGLARDTYSEQGKKKVSRQGIFEFLKTDINSFEVETVLADTDWRMLRLSFDCSCRQNFLSCKKLYDVLDKSSDCEPDVEELAALASKTPNVLKTVPAFYNIQLTQRAAGNCIYSPYSKVMAEKGLDCTGCSQIMEYDSFCKLIDDIAAFSSQAVINLSVMGEPLYHPNILECIEKVLSYDGLSVFLETDAVAECLNEDFYCRLSEIVKNAPERTNGQQKIMIAVNLDSVSDDMYGRIRQNGHGLEDALNSIRNFEQAVPGMVYPQFTRIETDEPELEAFYRFWNDKANVTKGNFIIQKYSDFAGLLPECKPADLSPVQRNVCWHLRRDMTILLNGDVPLCYCRMFNSVTGNVFSMPLQQIWDSIGSELLNQMNCEYKGECGKCDEYYIFNF